MIYITGDTHRNFRRIEGFCDRFSTTKDDILIILGDAGINYFLDERDRRLKEYLSLMPITLFCVHGNHEARPYPECGYSVVPFHEGSVYQQSAYPNILYAIDGEVYDFEHRSCLVIGGAYSADKYIRMAKGAPWFVDEQPSAAIKQRVENKVAGLNRKVDVVLSHTCPFKYIPQEMFLPGINQSTVDDSTERWLDAIEDKLTYNIWYAGHWHTTKSIHKMRFLFESYDALMPEDKEFITDERAFYIAG